MSCVPPRVYPTCKFGPKLQRWLRVRLTCTLSPKSQRSTRVSNMYLRLRVRSACKFYPELQRSALGSSKVYVQPRVTTFSPKFVQHVRLAPSYNVRPQFVQHVCNGGSKNSTKGGHLLSIILKKNHRPIYRENKMFKHSLLSKKVKS